MNAPEHNFNDAAMRLVVSHLEMQPAVRVPEDFGPRVRASLPNRFPLAGTTSFSPGTLGRRLLVIATATLVLLGCLLAPTAARNGQFWQTAEYVISAQILAYVMVLFLHRRTFRR